MLNRFLKKSTPSDQRAHYRRELTGADAIAVKVLRSDGMPVPATLVDLSAGGVAVDFSEEQAQHIAEDLQLDEQRDVIFSTLTESAIQVPALVRQTPSESHPYRFGFQFVDGGAFLEQLGPTVLKHFNRRRHRRAKPGLGETIRATVAFENVSVDVKLLDVSLGGASFDLAPDVAAQLAVDAELELAIKVPKTDYALVYHAVIRHMTSAATSVKVGVQMEVVSAVGGKRHLKRGQVALGDYIQRRLDEMDRYNSAFH